MFKFLAGVGGMALLVVYIATNQKPIPPESPPPQNCCLEYQRCLKENFQLKDEIKSCKDDLYAAIQRLNDLVDLIQQIKREKRALKDSLVQCSGKLTGLADSIEGYESNLLILNEELLLAEDSLHYLSDRNEMLMFERDTLRSQSRQLRNDYFVLDESMKKNQLTYLIFMITSVLSNILIAVYYRGYLNY